MQAILERALLALALAAVLHALRLGALGGDFVTGSAGAFVRDCDETLRNHFSGTLSQQSTIELNRTQPVDVNVYCWCSLKFYHF